MALTITSPLIYDLTAGHEEPITLTATGGYEPYVWTIDPPNPLPSGMSLNEGTGYLAGTPFEFGIFNIIIRVTDSNPIPENIETVTDTFTFNIADFPIFDDAQPSTLHIGTPLNFLVSVTGGEQPYIPQLGGTYPAWVTTTPESGGVRLGGTPNAKGFWRFAVQLLDELAQEITYRDVEIAIVDPNEGIGGNGLPFIGFTDAEPHHIGDGSTWPYINELPNQRTVPGYGPFGGIPPYHYVLTSSLPDFVLWNENYGPYNYYESPGTYIVSFDIVDSVGNSSSTSYQQTIHQSVVFTDATLPPYAEYHQMNLALPYARKDEAYVGYTLTNLQSVAATYTIDPNGPGLLPTGINLNESTGEISGTTAFSNVFQVRFKADFLTYSPGFANVNFYVLGNITVTNDAAAFYCNGDQFLLTCIASGSSFPPYTYALSTFNPPPAGFNIAVNENTGEVTGTVPYETCSFDVLAQDSLGELGVTTITLTVKGVVYIDTSIFNLTVGTSFSHTLTTQPNIPVTWVLLSGQLPPGIFFSNFGDQYFFSGTPTSDGITGDYGVVDVWSITLTPDPGYIDCAKNIILYFYVLGGPIITTTSLSDGLYNTYYSQTIQATGGTPFLGGDPYIQGDWLLYYHWSIVAGTLPVGFTLGPTNGVLSGIALSAGLSTTGTYSFTVNVTDSNNLSDTQEFTIRLLTTQEPPGGGGGGGNPADPNYILQRRLPSTKSIPVVVRDNFHQQHMVEYIPSNIKKK